MSQKQRSNQRFVLSTTGWARNMDFHQVSSLVRKYHIHYDGKRFRASDGLSKPVLSLSFQTRGSAQAARKKMFILADEERLRLLISLDELNVQRRHHEDTDDEAVKGDNGHSRPFMSSRVENPQPTSFFFQTVKQYRMAVEAAEKPPVETPTNNQPIQNTKIDVLKPTDSLIRPPSPSYERQPSHEQPVQSTQSPSLSSASPQPQKIYTSQLQQPLKTEETNGNDEVQPVAELIHQPSQLNQNLVVKSEPIGEGQKKPQENICSDKNETVIPQKLQTPIENVTLMQAEPIQPIKVVQPVQATIPVLQQPNQQCPPFHTCQPSIMQLEPQSTCDAPQAEMVQATTNQPRKLSGELLRQLHKDIIKERRNLNMFLRTARPSPTCH